MNVSVVSHFFIALFSPLFQIAIPQGMDRAWHTGTNCGTNFHNEVAGQGGGVPQGSRQGCAVTWEASGFGLPAMV